MRVLRFKRQAVVVVSGIFLVLLIAFGSFALRSRSGQDKSDSLPVDKPLVPVRMEKRPEVKLPHDVFHPAGHDQENKHDEHHNEEPVEHDHVVEEHHEEPVHEHPRAADLQQQTMFGKPLLFPGVSPKRMHGQVGVHPDGTPGWKLSDPPPESANNHAALRGNGFNRRLSDSISLDRDVPDFREDLCSSQTFDFNLLPKTSIVIVFYNEAWSPLMRSVHSVLNRSPPELLHEIVLVDDGSDKEWLQQQLEDYIKLLPKTRLVRQPTRSGLVKARLRGIAEATAQTFIVLDSHIEVQPGWLEPLMYSLSQGNNRMVMPMIDSINAMTFVPQAGGIGCTLGFLWTLIEHGMATQEHENKRRTSPIDSIRSPTMAGGLFGGHKDFFYHIGGYDEDWGFWGAENLELSFRLWQCGGILECMPCSRVYHIFRQGGGAYSLPGNHVTKNKLRTAHIWMDEFSYIVEEALGEPKVDIGSIDKMLQLRKDLNCKPFRWYLDNVYPESIVRRLSDIIHKGNFVHEKSGQCLDHQYRHSPGSVPVVRPCSTRDHSSQSWMLFKSAGLRPQTDLEICLMPDGKMTYCDWQQDVMAWEWSPNGLFKNIHMKKCLGYNSALFMGTCDEGNEDMRWRITHFDVNAALEKVREEKARRGISFDVEEVLRDADRN